MNGGAHEALVKRPPTDLELMMFVDGELEGERLREVRQAILRDSVLRSKVAALELSSDVVRENAEQAGASFDFADAIMSKIAAAPSAELDARDAASEPAHGTRKVAEVVPLVRPGLGKTSGKAGPTNDNARGIFALAAVAVAAAAGLMIWGRMDTDAPRPPSAPVAMVATEAAPLPAPAPEEHAAAPSADEGESVGVEVAAVDFGSRIGTIFYVPTEAATSNHTTTVVWLADDPVGGEQ
jgi:hypothetical protein